MKNLSKVMAVVLAFLMTISSVSFAAFTDVAENASYGEAVSVLNALGILKGDTDGAFRPDDTIKRSEFAAVVCRLLGLGEAGEGAKGQVVFTDVSGEHWASGYIALASQQGIVNGKGNGIFDPDADVKYEEAVKMIVAALGYTPMADTNGGYPGGYQIVAAQKGILAGVKGIQGSAASRSLVAQMCYNALEVPLMVQDGFGTEISFGYGNELLLNKLGITKIEGTVFATSASDDRIDEDEVNVRYDRQVTAFRGQPTASRQDVYKAWDNAINCNPSLSDVITISGTDAFATIYVDEKEGLADEVKDLLDLKVVMYVLDADTEDATLVAIAPKGTNNDIVEFKTEDINDRKTAIAEDDGVVTGEVGVGMDTDETFDVAIDKIYINGRTKVAYDDIDGVDVGSDTAANAEAILNYYLDSSVAADVKLLNNDARSDEYNIIYITAYKDYVVDKISAKNYSITSKDSKKVIFDEENKDYRFEIVKDGEKVSFADIQVNDVISLAGAFDATATKEFAYGTATITSQQVSGKVKSYSAVEGTITVGDETYSYDASKIALGTDIRLGDEVTMYLNARNVLVGVDKTQSKGNLKYGFATVIVETTDVTDVIKIRLMDTEGTWKTIEFASKVSIDGATAENTANVADWATEVGTLGDGATASSTTGNVTLVNKVVGYEVNGDGKISKIYFTPAANDPDEIYSAKALTAPEYREATEDFGSVLVNDATVIFSVPAFLTTRIAEEDVSVAKIDALVDRDIYEDATAINVDEDGYAAVIAGTNLVGAINKAGNFFTIASMTLTTNDEGEEGTLVKGIKAGEEETLFINHAETALKNAKFASGNGFIDDATTISSVNELGKGDVILYSKAANGDAKVIIRVMDASRYIATEALTNNRSTIDVVSFTAGGESYDYVVGFVTDLSSKRIALAKSIADNANEVVFSIKSDATMAYYDAFYATGRTTGIVGVADAGDIDAAYYDTSEGGTDEAGDIVFARVDGSTIVDAVIIKQFAE